MKKVSLILVLFLFVLVGNNCWAQQSQAETKWKKVHEFNVGKFPLEEADLDEDMEEEILREIVNVPQNSLVLVTGYTDSSGSPAFNEKLAKFRAKEVGKEMNSIKPGLQFNCTGDHYEEPGDADYRMVRVEAYVPIKASSQSQTKEKKNNQGQQNKRIIRKLQEINSTISRENEKILEKQEELNGTVAGLVGKVQDQHKFWKLKFPSLREKVGGLKTYLVILFVLSLLVAAIVLVVLYLSTRSQQKSDKQINEKLGGVKQDINSLKGSFDDFALENQDQERRIQEMEQELKRRWVEIDIPEIPDKKYWVLIERRDGFWYSPFVSKQGRFIYREDRKKLEKDSLISGFKKGKFKDQIQREADKGNVVIEKKDQGGQS